MIEPSKNIGRFQAYFDGEPIGTPSRQPLVDGATALIQQGYPANTLITMRHQGATHDSFNPAPIGTWAGITYKEGRHGPERRKHRP